MKSVLLLFVVLFSFSAQSASAGIVVTEVMSTSGAPAGLLSGLDWWELTNTGPGSVMLDGFRWEDMPISGDVSIFPNGITVTAGESIIIHQGTGIVSEFRTAWGLGPTVQVVEESQFTASGTNTFSGLSSGGDQVNVFDSVPTQVAGVTFAASTSGTSFSWRQDGTSLGLSVTGDNGAFASSYGGIGSPGFASISAIPEPSALGLATVTVLGLLSLRRSRIRALSKPL